MLISRAAYNRTAGWKGFEEFRSAGEDCDIFIKIEEVAPIELLDAVLYYYRLSDRRTSLVITDRAAYEMWRRLADDLSTVEEEAQRALDRARELAATATDLLVRRDELRGRLSAFQAKAVAQGLAEDPGLTALYGTAHDLLFTAPCDLRAATRAVFAYSQGLAGSQTRRTTDE